MHVYDKNKNTGRKPNWWVRYWVKKEEIREPGRGSQRATIAYSAELTRQIKSGTWVHPKLRRGTASRFDTYARAVIDRRVARGVATADKDERGHVENHLIPVFGKLQMHEMTFKRVKDGFEKHINPDKAGRTVRNIHSTLRAILLEALEDEIVFSIPPPLSVTRDHLPPAIDKVKGWRERSRFDAAEIAALATCADIPSARLIMYLTYFLTGSRFSEILELRLHHYNREKQPLHSLSVHAAKAGRHRGQDRRRREVPVHPDLQKWLDWWIGGEYEILHGRKPGPDDLLFPTISLRRLKRGLQTCSHGEIYKQWQRHDLPKAQLRHRKLHDARRTLLSALRNAGVPNDLRRKITHYSVEDRVLEGYTVLEWPLLCDAISKVKWNLPEPAPQRIRFLSTARERLETSGSR